MPERIPCGTDVRWPSERGRRSSIVAQFGRTRADLVHRALTTGDPLADAVVEEIHAGGKPVRDALAAGIAKGLGTLTDPPPAVAALLADTERVPGHVDDALIDEGCRPYFSVPPAVHAISLSAGALVRVYNSPAIAGLLTTTGRLVDAAQRRLVETGTWVNAAMLPGSLRPGGYGYTATLQVRMLHAHMRRFSRAHGYDESVHGTAINQVDMTRTWMDFTFTSYRAEDTMGFGRTLSEIGTAYRYWWYVAHLLGIDQELVAGISSHEQAERVDGLLQAVTGPPDAGSAALVRATLDAIAAQLHEVLSLPTGAGRQALYALTRRFHGHSLGDELELPRPALDALLTPAVAAVRRQRARRRADPDAWERVHRTGMSAARELIGEQRGTTTYETNG